MTAPIDFFNQIVIAKYNKPPGWRWYSLNAHKMPEDYVLVTGSVPTGVVSRGPRKGSPKWSGPGEQVFVRMSEVHAAQREYEERTGRCHVCQGLPRPSTRVCPGCRGTGLPKLCKEQPATEHAILSTSSDPSFGDVRSDGLFQGFESATHDSE